jgi:polyferredoxin
MRRGINDGILMKNKIIQWVIGFFVIFTFGLLPAIVSQFLAKEPIDRYIHIRNFRYGKSPWVIRCNRGDRLHLTFSSDDTGHSFFIEEFDTDVKVSPGVDEVTVFKTSNPSLTPVITKELTLTARHPGILNYIISKSQYRCHVWCGPMHAFEQGKLIILPNTLLCFSLGCLVGILFIWIISIFRMSGKSKAANSSATAMKDLIKKHGFFRKMIVSRWPQLVLTLLAMVMIYVVILTSVFGTKVSGRNLGVLMMWAIWLFLLIAVMTPLGGRIWCTICPLPMFGDWFQRRSFFTPSKGRFKEYNNKFSGLFLDWPKRLRNSWLRLFVFLILATFSTTLVATPRISGITVLVLLLVPTMMAFVWELRAFCRYVCPVSVFIGPFSRMSILALRNKSQPTCDRCKANYCQTGNANGWACPYGLNVGELKDNTECGLCLECMRTCTYNNVSLYARSFGSERNTRTMSESWLTIAIFTIAMVYSALYLGPWPVVRDYVNILDKQNWDLFGLYALILWSLVLLIIPGLLYLLSYAGSRLLKSSLTAREVFLASNGSLLPLGMMLWIAFVIPMLFVNITFIFQSASDPFGWGWDFFGTANIPWHQFMPRYIPWFQAILVLTGFYLSLRNIRKTWEDGRFGMKQVFLLCLPFASFLTIVSVAMLLFFVN